MTLRAVESEPHPRSPLAPLRWLAPLVMLAALGATLFVAGPRSEPARPEVRAVPVQQEPARELRRSPPAKPVVREARFADSPLAGDGVHWVRDASTRRARHARR
jgi:hypothetical protein